MSIWGMGFLWWRGSNFQKGRTDDEPATDVVFAGHATQTPDNDYVSAGQWEHVPLEVL